MSTDSLVATGQRKLHLDEKVEWIWECEKDKPRHGLYRYQHIQLVRDGAMRHFVTEVCPVIAHPAWKPFNFWAAGEYSVGECLEIAERLREGKPPENHEPINLALSYLQLLEEKHKRRMHASTFGPAITKVR